MFFVFAWISMTSFFKKTNRIRIINRYWFVIDGWKRNYIQKNECHAIHRYAEVNKKFMKNYHKKIISTDLMYLDASNLYGWEVFQKLPVNSF